MAQNTDITVVRGTWEQLTDADVAAITFQNKSGGFVFIKGTTDATEPTNTTGGIRYNPGQGEKNARLSDLFPGISAVRVWCYAPEGATMAVSHA